MVNNTKTEERVIRYRLLAGPLQSKTFERKVPVDTAPAHRIVVATALNGGEHHELVFTRDASNEGKDFVLHFTLSDCYRVVDEDGAPEYYAPTKWVHRACSCTWEGADEGERQEGTE